jgi:uncharacterized protein with PQ loop repeat
MRAEELANGEYRKHIEWFALAAGIVQPLITLPQIIQIYSSKSAQDVSLLTWLGYLTFGVIFLIYGAVFRLKPIWVGQIVWITMQSIVVIGILLYG